jgi:hypothetical protein
MKKAKQLFIKTDGEKWEATLLFRLLFLVSATAMTGLFAASGTYHVRHRYATMDVGILLSGGLFCWLIFKQRLLERVFADARKPKLILCAVFSVFAVYEYGTTFYDRILGNIRNIINKGLRLNLVIDTTALEMLTKLLAVLAIVCPILAMAAFLYAFYRRLSIMAADWFSVADRIEKRYLCGAGLVFSLSVMVVFNITNVFYGENYIDYYDMEKGEWVYNYSIKYNIVYTTDSPTEVNANVYVFIGVIENDLRNSLFGLFALPFALPCLLLSRLLFFIPNTYPLALDIVQVFLILMIWVTLARMMRLWGYTKILFLAAASLTYPVLLHLFAMGQYVFSTFWLILLIYAYIEDKEWKRDCFLAAAGSLITSIVMFPLVLRGKAIKIWLRDLGGQGAKIGTLAVIFGQFALFATIAMSASDYREFYLRFTGHQTAFPERILQFVNAVSSFFLKPETWIGMSMVYGNNNISYISYQLAPATSLNIWGLALLLLAIAGFVLNRHDRFAKICFAWLLFSVVVLCLIGWGTPENGLIIYSLYFGWPYFVLVFMLAEKLLARFNTFRYALYAVAVMTLAVVNLYGIADLIDFAVEYYPR